MTLDFFSLAQRNIATITQLKKLMVEEVDEEVSGKDNSDPNIPRLSNLSRLGRIRRRV